MNLPLCPPAPTTHPPTHRHPAPLVLLDFGTTRSDTWRVAHRCNQELHLLPTQDQSYLVGWKRVGAGEGWVGVESANPRNAFPCSSGARRRRHPPPRVHPPTHTQTRTHPPIYHSSPCAARAKKTVELRYRVMTFGQSVEIQFAGVCISIYLYMYVYKY